MKTWHWVVGGIAAALLLLFWSTHSSLVSGKNGYFKQIAEVQSAQKRRADLIPNAVEVLKGAYGHENELVKQWTESNAKMGQINIDISKVSGDPAALLKLLDEQQKLLAGFSATRFLALAQSAPQTQLKDNILALQADLTASENLIFVARKRMNDEATSVNNAIETFPGNVVNAIVTHYRPFPTFKADEQDTKTPKIDFGFKK